MWVSSLILWFRADEFSMSFFSYIHLISSMVKVISLYEFLELSRYNDIPAGIVLLVSISSEFSDSYNFVTTLNKFSDGLILISGSIVGDAMSELKYQNESSQFINGYFCLFSEVIFQFGITLLDINLFLFIGLVNFVCFIFDVVYEAIPLVISGCFATFQGLFLHWYKLPFNSLYFDS